MSTWLVMMAVGGANENVLSLVIAYCPPYLSIWLMTWIILNISASFYPMVLNNEFYRYGYIMPIHNAVDIYKVIFEFNQKKNGKKLRYSRGMGCPQYILDAILYEVCR